MQSKREGCRHTPAGGVFLLIVRTVVIRMVVIVVLDDDMCIVMLWSQSEILSSAKELLRKVGKMAFTNYILTSLICFLFVFITNLFGEIERIYQFMLTLIVWSILLLFTQLWNKSFRMGPLEWLWRSLTYWKWAKIK